ncbi:MAG TPA: hypothetical protein VLZ12_03370 [Verrucomicrobiae bacterium]|nr:hypothetical protein [Verrucomicrobiae bacterium]
MSEEERLRSEELVEIHKARTEWEGNLVVGFLKDNGVEATLEQPPAVPPLDDVERLSGVDRNCGVVVLEHDAKRARELVKEFISAATDEQVLEEEAARTLRVDKETIRQLRGEVREERRTFRLLGWLGVVFLGAVALLWAIWPSWLKIAPPAPGFQWLMVIVLAVAAVFAGSWASRRM